MSSPRLTTHLLAARVLCFLCALAVVGGCAPNSKTEKASDEASRSRESDEPPASQNQNRGNSADTDTAASVEPRSDAAGSAQAEPKASASTRSQPEPSAKTPPQRQTGSRVRVVSVPGEGKVPDAEIDDEGVIHLTYFAGDNVYYVKSADQGWSFREPTRVNSEVRFASGGAHRGPDLAVGKEGRIHVVWYNDGYRQKRPKNQWGVMYSRLIPGADGFERSRNLNRKPSDNFSVAADNNGNVAVIWMAGGVFTNLSDDGGDTFSPPLDLKTDPCECCASRAIYTSDGSLSVLYRDKAENYRDTYLAFLAEGERTFTHVKASQTPWYITSCPMTGSFLSANQEGLVAGWETKGQIYFARLDNRGQHRSRGEIHVCDAGRYPVALTATDSTTLVAWKNGNELQWQLFDAQDNPVGQRGSRACDTNDRPSGVVTKQGRFILFP